MADRTLSVQTVVGVFIVLVGAVLLLDTTGVYETGPLFRYAPSLFVLAGLYALYASGFRNIVGPVALVLLAGGAQLVALDLVTVDALVDLWPVFVILFGLSLLAGRFQHRGPTPESGFVDAFALFSGTERRASGSGFEGANLTALFGGTTLDLRDVSPEDRPVRVNVTVLFGGAEIIAPREWNVRFDVLPILGAAEDERLRGESDHDETDLVVTGFVAFGGVSLKD